MRKKKPKLGKRASAIRPKPTISGTPIKRGQLVQFDYVNWKTNDYHYVIEIESVEFGPYGRADPRDTDRSVWHWLLHGTVVTRDGDPRPEMGPTRRRSFIIERIRDLEEWTP